MEHIKIICILTIFLWLISVIITLYDKFASKRQDKTKLHIRIPEKTLLLLGAVGGAVPMYITMRLIHHKTKKKKFMVTLPVFGALHILIVLLFVLHKFNVI